MSSDSNLYNEECREWVEKNVTLNPQGLITIDQSGRCRVGYTITVSDLRADEINSLLKSVYYRLREEREACAERLAKEERRLAKNSSDSESAVNDSFINCREYY